MARPAKPEFTPEPCECKITYDFTESLLVLFQKASGQQTHEVLSTLEVIAMNMIKDFEIDLYTTTDTYTWNSWRQRWQEDAWKKTVRKIAVTYPNTDISCYLEFTFRSGQTDYRSKSKSNSVRFNFYVPNKKITYTSERMNEVISEGIIFDATEDLKEMQLKSHKTPQELKDLKLKKKKTKTDSITP